jgi:c-di-GMP phosphodiesterase
MAEVFVARQPIFNRSLRLAGYELLFRGGPVSEALIASPEGATASVVLNSFTEIGLERIIGRQLAWVNVTREFLVSGLARTLPPRLVGLEILEDQLLDDELITELRELKRLGYQLALDDFEYRPTAHPLLRLVDVVKLDLRALGREGLAHQVARLKPYGLTLVAEKVETPEDHAFCLDTGCEFFQGYFFCRPELIRSRGIEASRLSVLQLVSALQDPAVELAQLGEVISRDVTLTFRLLRYINSAFFGLRCEVSSIGQALALLGVENLKRWATLSVFASVDGKPPELTVTALVRAHFCKLVGSLLRCGTPGELFILGLFSVLDALTDSPMDEALASIPIPNDMRTALTSRIGQKGALIECVTALEAGDFEVAHSIFDGADELYVQALVWANRAAEALLEPVETAAA